MTTIRSCLMIGALGIGVLLAPAVRAAERPNVLFIAIDDLNDWVGCLGGHPQSITPNLDRLAASGVLFTNAHCPAASCNPSRTAIMTGISPHCSGLYRNDQKMRQVLPDAPLLSQYFRDHGYWAGGSGKLLHYFIDAQSWDEYYPAKEREDPFPRTLYPETRPLSLPRGGNWQYVETDWGPLDATEEEYGGDWLVSRWVGDQLSREHDKPFFLACGIYRPHEPWFVPKKYFEPFPLETIKLPPGYRENDLDDLPPAGKKRGPNRYFEHIRKHGQWKQGIQGYLASIHFADAMLGRVLDSLEKGPSRDNTIVVLWSDHGWHLGEKQHWQKFTAWRACTRIPLIVRVPAGIAPGLMQGTKAGGVCEKPVDLLSLYPTLTQLAGLPPRQACDGQNLTPLLENPEADWDHVALTHLGTPGTFGLSAEGWRYIRYTEGGEELYWISRDPYEWENLAQRPEYRAKLEELRALGPKEFRPLVKPPVASFPALEWIPAGANAAPRSKADGGAFQVHFINRRTEAVNLHVLDEDGNAHAKGRVGAGKMRALKTRPGQAWQVAQPGSSEPLGYFVVDDRQARAVIPAGALLETPRGSE